MKTITSLALAAALGLAAFAASAQDNVVKLGGTYYTTNSKTDGVSGIGVPPGADAKVGNASTVIFVYERMFTPNIGAELVMGIPPRIKAKATGTVAFLGDDVLSAKIVAPTLFATYHFFEPTAVWRPYVGLGVNYTKFTNVETSLAPHAEMGDSWGVAGEAGVSYALNKQVSLFGSVAALKVKSKVVATGTTVIQTTVDFRPVVFSLGAAYAF